jgi:hypothetical protein
MYHGERFNSITHLVGTALAIAGSVVLIAHAALDGDPWKIVSFSVFGTMLVVLYAISRRAGLDPVRFNLGDGALWDRARVALSR